MLQRRNGSSIGSSRASFRRSRSRIRYSSLLLPLLLYYAKWIEHRLQQGELPKKQNAHQELQEFSLLAISSNQVAVVTGRVSEEADRASGTLFCTTAPLLLGGGGGTAAHQVA